MVRQHSHSRHAKQSWNGKVLTEISQLGHPAVHGAVRQQHVLQLQHMGQVQVVWSRGVG